MKFIISYLVLLITCNLNLFAQKSFMNAMKNGKVIYEKTCLTCHQANGGGVPRMNPPLVNAAFVNGDKNKLIQWVLLGSTEKVPIDGKYYSNNMPAQATLKDQDIAEVLTFIRNSFENKASQVTASEVKSVRMTTRK
jgi:mono/diheme cytochrome c family protein